MISDPRAGAPRFHAWWSGDQQQVGEFIHGYHSTWLSQSLLHADQRSRLTGALFEGSRQWTIGLHFNKGLAGAESDPIAKTQDTATNPLALEAFCLAIVSGEGPPAFLGLSTQDLNTARDNAAKMKRATDALRTVVPVVGSYVSESDFFEPNWRQAYWGGHHLRLQQIKQRYDPDGLFVVHHGVGPES